MVRYRVQMQGLRRDDGSRDAAARKKMGKLMEQMRAEVRAVLTPKQQVVYDRNAAQLRERRADRGGGSRQPPE
jgi:Spy/CpxP family protein refolding chaperone